MLQSIITDEIRDELIDCRPTYGWTYYTLEVFFKVRTDESQWEMLESLDWVKTAKLIEKNLTSSELLV